MSQRTKGPTNAMKNEKNKKNKKTYECVCPGARQGYEEKRDAVATGKEKRLYRGHAL